MDEHVRVQERIILAMAHGRPLDRATLDHVSGCAACGAAMDRLSAAERAMSAQDAGLSARAMDAVEASLPWASFGAPPARRRTAWAMVSASFALAAGLLLVVRAPGDGYTARGDGPVASSVPRVRLMCAQAGGMTADARTDAPAAQAMRCSVSGTLLVAATVPPGSAFTHVFVVGETAAREARWYRPRPEEERSIPLPPAGQADTPLAAVRLDVNHGAGSHRVHAIFSRGPLDLETVRDGLAQGRLQEVLPDGVLLQTVEMDLQ